MNRIGRLLRLLNILRRQRRPVSAISLAGELGVSQRTIRRDISELVASGASIEGEAGIGYSFAHGAELPVLAFGPDELEALRLGLRWVRVNGDPALQEAAGDALGRIFASLPSSAIVPDTALGVAPRGSDLSMKEVEVMPVLRHAVRDELRVRFDYQNGADAQIVNRVVWPIAIGYFAEVRVLAAWCETRAAVRHFRVDRISTAHQLDAMPVRRDELFRKWIIAEEARHWPKL